MPLRISSLNHRLPSAQPDGSDDLHDRERRWFAVRTAARHEKRAVAELRRAGIECYIPLREKTAEYAGKRVTRQLPLLAGYVFVRIRRSEERTVHFAHYVSGFVRLGRIRRRVTEAEMDLLRRLSTDRDLSWEAMDNAFDFRLGTPVEIIRGPLAGVRGHYVTKKNKKTFVISLGGLGACLATCEVDPTVLVALAGGAAAPASGERAPHAGKKTLW